MSLTATDFFCGMGGSSTGLVGAGYLCQGCKRILVSRAEWELLPESVRAAACAQNQCGSAHRNAANHWENRHQEAERAGAAETATDPDNHARLGSSDCHV